MDFTLYSVWIYLLVFSFQATLGSFQLLSSTIQLVSDSSGPICAADRATTVSQVRSLMDCQRRCATPKNKCYATNFYTDTNTCELYNFKPTTFTSSRETCQLFLNYKVSRIPMTYACLIQAVSYGNSDVQPLVAYISINGSKVAGGLHRGFNTVELNVSSCSATAGTLRNFDTFSLSNADKMAAYLQNLSLPTVLIGVTLDEPSLYLNANDKSALLAIGVNVNAMQYRGKVSFVAQIGQPNMTVYRMGPSGGYSSNVTVLVQGTSATSDVTLIRLE